MSDLKELVTTERFHEIHDARQQVIEDERTLNEALAVGRIDDSRARRLYQRSVDTFVRELEWLLAPTEDDEGSAYWTDKEIGKMELPDERVLEVAGLGQYLELDEEIVVEVKTNRADRYCEVATPDVERLAVQPSWGLLRDAFRKANAALNELGMELDAGDEDRAEIDADLVDEVIAWRKANI